MNNQQGEYKLADPVEENVFQMSSEERKWRGIDSLPRSLAEVISLTENNQLVRNALSDHIFNSFVQNKKIEWNQYRTQITEYELRRYLPISRLLHI